VKQRQQFGGSIPPCRQSAFLLIWDACHISVSTFPQAVLTGEPGCGPRSRNITYHRSHRPRYLHLRWCRLPFITMQQQRVATRSIHTYSYTHTNFIYPLSRHRTNKQFNRNTYLYSVFWTALHAHSSAVVSVSLCLATWISIWISIWIMYKCGSNNRAYVYTRTYSDVFAVAGSARTLNGILEGTGKENFLI
jgi:hypothetical protein